LQQAAAPGEQIIVELPGKEWELLMAECEEKKVKRGHVPAKPTLKVIRHNFSSCKNAREYAMDRFNNKMADEIRSLVSLHRI
jgi:phosphopentomutase